jgi:hypothetical protein
MRDSHESHAQMRQPAATADLLEISTAQMAVGA